MLTVWMILPVMASFVSLAALLIPLPGRVRLVRKDGSLISSVALFDVGVSGSYYYA